MVISVWGSSAGLDFVWKIIAVEMAFCAAVLSVFGVEVGAGSGTGIPPDCPLGDEDALDDPFVLGETVSCGAYKSDTCRSFTSFRKLPMESNTKKKPAIMKSAKIMSTK
ncbi:MAG: hypothetical protein UW92_C0026G0004 [Candidatus Jorgensenbacteria bacterium GW2011_GWA2_45_13]|uniref:Uncharacterized protein n=1 Tax=Candidatus Jorgensenbacteria bacterium GW2011_GWA2_45_13 TaxID=1618662 RepID=A0A0G1NCF6_9BACT|nr:MAG: hypothetical protein UW92_C0026G0004 [Candidatus Jorgensenbacteria bacterium GW2011_GWA2_45_13]